MTITLHLPSVNNSMAVEYRMHRESIQRRELLPDGREAIDGGSDWRDATDEDIHLAYASRTRVADWLDEIVSGAPHLAIAREIAGERKRISRAEMAAIITRLEAAGLIEPDNGWAPRTRGSLPRSSLDRRHGDDLPTDLATAWAESCRDIMLISVLPPGQGTGSNPSALRYDQPGSLHPQMQAVLMFVSADAAERRATFDYLEDHAQRVLIVEE
jgi:hypothetical protein